MTFVEIYKEIQGGSPLRDIAKSKRFAQSKRQ